ncbi:MAG: hypothetical protein IKJ07_07515 [Clostridia bacterium]|nr:hypothetical protein [Clostridia bacterium]
MKTYELLKRVLEEQERLIAPLGKARVQFPDGVGRVQIIFVAHDVRQAIILLEQLGAIEHGLQIALPKIFIIAAGSVKSTKHIKLDASFLCIKVSADEQKFFFDKRSVLRVVESENKIAVVFACEKQLRLIVVEQTNIQALFEDERFFGSAELKQ